MNIQTAVEQLSRSETGRHALEHVLAFVDGPGLSLDGQNQEAVAALLVSAWGAAPSGTRDLIREALGVATT